MDWWSIDKKSLTFDYDLYFKALIALACLAIIQPDFFQWRETTILRILIITSRNLLRGNRLRLSRWHIHVVLRYALLQTFFPK